MDSLRGDVERLLSESAGSTVELAASVEVLRTTNDGYATVGRFHVDNPSDFAPTVVVKRPSNWAPFDPSSAKGLAGGFFNEWAALEFLDGTDLAPQLLAGDREKGSLVLEDLGDGLADALLGSDPAEAKAQLMAFTDALDVCTPTARRESRTTRTSGVGSAPRVRMTTRTRQDD